MLGPVCLVLGSGNSSLLSLLSRLVLPGGVVVGLAELQVLPDLGQLGVFLNADSQISGDILFGGGLLGWGVGLQTEILLEQEVVAAVRGVGRRMAGTSGWRETDSFSETDLMPVGSIRVHESGRVRGEVGGGWTLVRSHGEEHQGEVRVGVRCSRGEGTRVGSPARGEEHRGGVEVGTRCTGGERARIGVTSRDRSRVPVIRNVIQVCLTGLINLEYGYTFANIDHQDTLV